jgi:low affinity Fe/Cu permease
MSASSWYSSVAKTTARITGRPVVFVGAVLLIVAWVVTGPMFGFSDTWQLVINTATTILTFLMVLLIQNTQNRDTDALHLKLDELIRATHGAHNALLDLEEMEESQLDEFRQRYEALAKQARLNIELGNSDTDAPDV